MMDSDEDDIYPDNDEVYGSRQHGEVKMEDAEDGEEEGEEVEEDDDDDDDDINFIIDAKDETKPSIDTVGSGSGSQAKRPPGLSSASENIRKASSSTPQLKTETSAARSGSQPPTADNRLGTDFPARHTSKLDPNGNPVHPVTGKPILSTDFDLDFPSESSKPWRKPGADITDYFNYGFDEFTWASYCLKQQTMPKEVKEITQQAEQMKAFVEGIPGQGGAGGGGTGSTAGGAGAGAAGLPGMPAMPGVPGVPGGDVSQMAMPSEAQMQQMFAAMTSQGLDPTSMDPSQFMQFMAGPGAAAMMGGPQPPTGPAAGFAGPGGGGGGSGGFDPNSGGGGGGNFGGGRGRGKGGRRNW